MSIASSVSAQNSYCKSYRLPALCHGSEDLCGPSLLSTSSPGHTTPSPIPITTDPVGITTTASSASFDWDGYCREQVDGVSYCKYWSEPPVCHGSEVPCSGPPAPTPTTPNVTPGDDPYDCFKTLQCDADTDGAIAELEGIFGIANILTGDKIRSVFMPQYTGVQPLAAIRPRSEGDILIIMDVCFRHRVAVVVRSPAGSSFAGQSTVHDGIVILMDEFSSVEVSKAAEAESGYVAEIGAGTRLLEAYTRLYDHNPPLSINGGSCPSVSVSGLAQGGAYGYSSTMWGMLADHVMAVDIVVQEHGGPFKLVHATRTNDHADLLKALRGGMGGNYGVVTKWYLSAIRASEKVYIYRHQVAANSKSKADVLAKTKAYQNVMINQPSSNGLWGKVKIHSNFEMHYEGMCLCDPITSDCTDCDETMDKVDSAVQANTWITKPSQKFTNAAYGAWSWAGCTKWADPDCPSDAVYPGTGVDPTSAMDNCWAYDWSLNENLPWKSNSVYVRESDMTDSFWDTIWDLSHQPECQKGRNICIITFEYYGGKMLDEPTDCSGAGPCTSFIHRHQGWNVQVSSLWNKGDSAGEETSTNWVAKAFAAIDQFSSLEESYQNYISNQWTVERWKDKFFPGQDVQPDHWKYRYFGPLSNGVYNRLQEVKCHYNPYNLFTTPTTADIAKAAYMEAKAAYMEAKAAYMEVEDILLAS
ncbi:hypothetical protein FOZ60_005061 [Perkinsus olseni]|uniref:FAD-binding PCMH-type domain-containing protein n=1 Tax=Perkinsus olseni TaxID=32597 RepID=A0A7J6NRR6_PEROL|nr:hypothetical protein FOZ60_005061 [Perkinsus olseni]